MNKLLTTAFTTLMLSTGVSSAADFTDSVKENASKLNDSIQASASKLQDSIKSSAYKFEDSLQDPYFGGQVSSFNLDANGVGDSINPSAGIARIGIRSGEWVLFEGRIGTGIADDSEGLRPNEVTADIGYLLGGYLIAKKELANTFSPYAALGATVVDIDTSPVNIGTENSLSYGVGVDARVSEKISVNTEYMRYIDADKYDLDAISVGVKSRF